MYIVKPGLDDEAYQALVERFSSLVQAQGGSVDSIDKWGTRKLAYEIDGNREGYYVVMNFTGNPATAAELDRVMKITDEIVRHLIVRTDR